MSLQIVVAIILTLDKNEKSDICFQGNVGHIARIYSLVLAFVQDFGVPFLGDQNIHFLPAIFFG